MYKQTRLVTLTYAIATDEDMNLDFEQQADESWQCILSADEMNRILKTAYDAGKMDTDNDS